MKKHLTKQNSSRSLLVNYNGEALSLTDIFPIGYLAGCTVQEAIQHDHRFVDKCFNEGLVLKGDSIKFLVALKNSRTKFKKKDRGY